MIGLRGSEGAKLNKAISHKTQDILMAEEQAVHVRGNSSEVGGQMSFSSLHLLPGVRV